MKNAWVIVLVSVLAGALLGGIMGYFSGTYGFPIWIAGAVGGMATPLVFFLMRSKQ
ncbi:MAG: hypothetical protein R3C30_07675 [Hyphomonadaceae bacterium]